MDCLELRDYFEHQYDLHKNVHNPLVNWDNMKLTKQRCGVVLKCMGARVLVMFLGRLARDFVQWRFGMPDLILWKEARPPQQLKQSYSQSQSASQRAYTTT